MADGEKMNVRTMIKKALLSLLSEKSYLDITVTDIIKRAEVARVSFYRNFTGIDQVLDSIVDDKIEEMEKRIKPLLAYGDKEEHWRIFMRTVFESKLAMQQNNTVMAAINKQYIHVKIDGRVQEKFAQVSGETLEDKYVFPAQMGIVHSVSDMWLKTGAEESPDEMADIVLKLMLKLY